jgi:hypothetical protein
VPPAEDGKDGLGTSAVTTAVSVSENECRAQNFIVITRACGNSVRVRFFCLNVAEAAKLQTCAGNKHFFFVPCDVKTDTRAGRHTRHARSHKVTVHLLLGMSNIAGTHYLCVDSGHRVSV